MRVIAGGRRRGEERGGESFGPPQSAKFGEGSLAFSGARDPGRGQSKQPIGCALAPFRAVTPYPEPDRATRLYKHTRGSRHVLITGVRLSIDAACDSDVAVRENTRVSGLQTGTDEVDLQARKDVETATGPPLDPLRRVMHASDTRPHRLETLETATASPTLPYPKPPRSLQRPDDHHGASGGPLGRSRQSKRSRQDMSCSPASPRRRRRCGGHCADLADPREELAAAGPSHRLQRSGPTCGALLAAVTISAHACAAAASPVARPTPASASCADPSSGQNCGPIDPHSRRPLNARPTLRARAPVPPRYVNSDGQWVEDYGWTLRGKGTTDPAAAEVTAYSTAYPKAMPDHEAPTTTYPSATPTEAAAPDVAGLGVDFSTSASPSSTTTTATSSAVSIPNGWQAIPRETNYYAVPLVIAVSVLVAVLVVISIFISVIVRRNKRRRRKARAARKARRRAAAAGDVGDGNAAAARSGKEVPADVDDTRGEKGWRGAIDKVRSRQGRRQRRRAAKRAAAAAAVGRGDDESGEDDEDPGRPSGAPSVRRRVRVTGFSAAGVRGSLRRRRRAGDGADGQRSRSGDDGASEAEEERALTRSGTRSSAASIVEDTMTSRIAARLRSDSGAARRSRSGASTTVFSSDVPAGSVVSLTASALDRIASRTSQRSIRTEGGVTSSSASIRSTHSALLPTTSAPEILFTPADDPTLPDHLAIPGSPHSIAFTRSAPSPTPGELTPSSSRPTTSVPLPAVSSFGAMIATDTLPAPGPPAYRPSTSTVQRTRRFADPDQGPADAVSRLGAARRRLRRERRESAGTSTERAGSDAEEGEWHWPGEKGWPLASGSSSNADPFVGEQGDAVTIAGPSPDDVEQEEPPPVDRSMYSAHVATDDKAVLARLRTHRERSPFVLDDEEANVGMAGSSAAGPSFASSTAPRPSAPPMADDVDLDEDGFERFDFATPRPSSISPRRSDFDSGRTTSLLPAPPRRVAQTSLTGGRPDSPSSAPTVAPFLSSASSTAPLLQDAKSSTESVSYFPSAKALGKAREADRETASGEEVDDESLPMYLPGSNRATETLRMASAPAHDDEDDAGDDRDDTVARVVRSAGQLDDDREEEGVV